MNPASLNPALKGHGVSRAVKRIGKAPLGAEGAYTYREDDLTSKAFDLGSPDGPITQSPDGARAQR